MKLIRNSFAIILIVSLMYITERYFLERYFSLLFRDWIWALVIIISIFCILVIEVTILINLNNIFEKRLPILKIWNGVIQIIAIVLILLVNLYALLFCILIISMGYKEVGVETYKGEKYLIRDTGWMTPDHFYNYHPYKNLFVYGKDIKYSGEVKWEDYMELKIDRKKESNYIPNTIEEDTDNDIEDEEKEILPIDVEYIQKVDDNLNYGFYLIDRAGHQYSYAFVQSNNDSLSWEIIYRFPTNSEIYYGHFLNKELGFINFGSSEGLSLFMTNDGGVTWKDVLIDLSEENKDMLYVQDIRQNGEEIELILGSPSWSNSNKSIKYISIDKGLSWDLKI